MSTKTQLRVAVMVPLYVSLVALFFLLTFNVNMIAVVLVTDALSALFLVYWLTRWVERGSDES